LLKDSTGLQNFTAAPQGYEVVYFDAFAPSKQPELWQKEALAKTVTPLNEQGVWVSYSAKGQLKRDLAALQTEVQSVPGPPGKKEMTRAIKLPSLL